MYTYKLPSGRWRVEVRRNGQRRSATATTLGAVKLLGAQMEMDLGATPGASPTVAELIEGHLASVHLSPTTRADYQRVSARLPDEFTNRVVSEVTASVIEALYRQLAAGGYSPHRIRRVHDLLGVAWRRAERFEWTAKNPIRVVSPPAFEQHEIIPPTRAQVAALIAAATADFKPFVRLAASTGARRSELVALQWGDVDLDDGQVVIQRSLVYTPATGVVERQTKTGRKGFRRIAIAAGSIDALETIRARQVEHGERSQVTPRWVFSANAGVDPWFPEYPTTAFEKARTAAKLDGVRLHDLRHFVATQMLAKGYSVAQVAARLGQTQAATTHRYSHWIPSKDRDAATDLEDLG